MLMLCSYKINLHLICRHERSFEEILQVEAWTKIEGRRRDIEHTFEYKNSN
jgi:hypothetical protein